MKIKFLGTAAAEGVPAIGCCCEVCKKARALGGRNIRSRSQALINNDLLIEFNPDTVWHMNAYGLDLSEINNCLITHSHPDHLYPEDIDNFRPHYCHGRQQTMNFYAAEDGYLKIKNVSDRNGMDGAVTPHLLIAGKRFDVLNGKYSVLPLWANHNPATSPVIYSIACENKKLLYAHDTGLFPENTKELLKKEGRFDLISLDCTGCLGLNAEWRNGHMSLKTNLETIDWLRREGIADNNTVLVANHYSHNGGQVYDDMLSEAEKYGILISYDGLEINF